MTKKKIEKIPVHQWVNSDGDVLVLRFSDKDGKSHEDFQHPMIVGETVTAPDWKANQECGGGIHGWAWGIGIGDGKEPDWNNGLWQVYAVKPENIIGDIDDGIKCKFHFGTLVYLGGWYEASLAVLDGQKQWVEHFADGQGYSTGNRSASSATGNRSASSATGDSSASSATGDSSASSATGDRSASSATGDSSASSATGDRSASSATGYRSASSATGYRSASSATGNRSASSATGYRSASSATGNSSASSATGYSSASSATGNSSASSATGNSSASSATGNSSAAIVTGCDGKAMAGQYGCIALAFWNIEENRSEMRCAETGCGDGSDGKLKANVWYKLDESGNFIEE
jgi:hypothetical protein